MSKADRKALKAKYNGEVIAVIPAEHLGELAEGLVAIEDSPVNILEERFYYIPRFTAEYNPVFRQPIPYTVVQALDTGRYFVTKRLEKGGEARLHGLMSIGTGGHMDEADGGSFVETIIRELEEETTYEDYRYDNYRILGYINDLSNEVSQDHIGIIGVMEVPSEADVAIREVEQLEGVFMSSEELRAAYDRFETWSQIAIDSFLK